MATLIGSELPMKGRETMKQKIRFILCGMLILATLIGSVYAATFSDVSKNASYAEAVDYVSSTGLMVGYGDGKFQPEKTVTRAEMATVLCKLLGEDKNLKKDGSKFKDVPASHWGNAYVAKAASLGILSGYGNGKFGPDDTVTYEQALTMVVNALGCGGSAGYYGGYPNGYVTAADKLGLLSNINSGIGKKQTRGNIAIMLFNIDQTLNSGRATELAAYKTVWQDQSVYNNEGVILEYGYGQVVLQGSSNAQKEINRVIKADCMRHLQRLSSDDLEYYLEDSWATVEFPYCDTAGAMVSHNANSIFSVKMGADWYMGGVYDSWSYGMTFDLNTGRKLTLEDFFDSATGALPYLKTVVFNEFVKKELGDWDDLWEDISETMESLDEVDFYIQDGEIILCVPRVDYDVSEYEVPTGIYVCGDKTKAPSNWKKHLTQNAWCAFEQSSYGPETIFTEFTFNSDNSLELWIGFYASSYASKYTGNYTVSNNGLVTIRYQEEFTNDDYETISGDRVAHEASYQLQTSGNSLIMTQTSKKGLFFDDTKGKVVLARPGELNSFWQ